MKKFFLLFVLVLSAHFAFPQDKIDSLKTLDEVTIRAFEQNRRQFNSTAAVRVISGNSTDRVNKTSLVHSFNSVAGVRMEERSPGSYRLNIRGSSLRSPFGVRNIKVYWNDIPITDPAGNTYFNQFAWNNFSSIEVFKGPAGSLYGAGTGGLVLMNNFDNWQPGASLELMGGSYNLKNIFASARFGKNENRNQLTYAHNKSDGYRIQTNMRRDNLSWQSQLKVSDKQQLTASLLFSDMYYQTPGALTLAEYNNDPKAARPAAGGFPSAVAARAAIWQKNITAGFSNQYRFNEHFKNSSTIYGSYAEVKNAAVRNYERRKEPQFGGRTVFTYNKQQGNTIWQWVAGAEFQQGFFNTQVADNRNGNPDTLRTNDDINNKTYNIFAQGDVAVNEKWFITAGLSLTKTKVDFSRLSIFPVLTQSRTYQNELAPRISLLRKINADLALLATVSRGFSPPTIAELLPSTGIISTELEAEQGWNYEMTIRYALFRSKLRLEATGFYFRLNEALVQRRDLSGADFFVNAGDVKQKGIELHADYTLAPTHSPLIDYLAIRGAYSYNHFRYGSFIKGSDDFSGKTVPSVPQNIFSLLADLQLKNGLYSNATFYAASRIFLNDANTAVANAYQLLGWRIGWKKTIKQQHLLNLYAGADNLLDEKYSLGNDINAAANRFYNAAPRRNYYVGIAFQWLKK